MRRLLPLAMLLSVVFAGCLAAAPDGPASGTPTLGTTGQAANNPDGDHAVHVENQRNQSMTLTLRVVHEETGEVVHERTWSQSPSGEHEVYNLEQADPDGVERFRVVLELSGRTEAVHLETSGCYGDAFFTVTEQGELSSTYAIC